MALTLEERVTRLEEKIFPPVCKECGAMFVSSSIVIGGDDYNKQWYTCAHGHKWVRDGDRWETYENV